MAKRRKKKPRTTTTTRPEPIYDEAMAILRNDVPENPEERERAKQVLATFLVDKQEDFQLMQMASNWMRRSAMVEMSDQFI